MNVILDVLPGNLVNQAEVRAGPSGTIIEIPIGTDTARIQPLWAGQGFPRDLDLAIANVPNPSAGEIVFAAVAISPGARARLKELEFSWADETGRADLEVSPNLYIVRDTQAIKSRRSGQTDDRWNPSVAAIAETVLVEALESQQRHGASQGMVLDRVQQLSASAVSSPSLVVKALQIFDRAGYTTKSGAERGPTARRTLTNAGDLLSAWAGWQQKQRPKRQGMHVLWGDIREFNASDLAPALDGHAWALTGWLAADVVAPYAKLGPSFSTYVDATLFDRGLSEVARQAGLRPVDTGARVTFIRAEPHVLPQSQQIDGIPYVSLIRLYGDLIQLGARGDDAASHLRETRIGW